MDWSISLKIHIEFSSYKYPLKFIGKEQSYILWNHVVMQYIPHIYTFLKKEGDREFRTTNYIFELQTTFDDILS